MINRLTVLLPKQSSNGVLLFQIVTSAKEAVTGAKEAVGGTMNGAKESVSSTLSEVTDRTRGAVQDGMEKTKTGGERWSPNGDGEQGGQTDEQQRGHSTEHI